MQRKMLQKMEDNAGAKLPKMVKGAPTMPGGKSPTMPKINKGTKGAPTMPSGKGATAKKLPATVKKDYYDMANRKKGGKK